jgi:hypothetical protein
MTLALRWCGVTVLLVVGLAGAGIDMAARRAAAHEAAYSGADLSTYENTTAGVLTLYLVGVFLILSLLIQRRSSR